MPEARIKAHLNLCAVLQNLEDLVRLDADMAALTKDWDIAVQFSVSGGPKAYVAFKDGACTHGVGSCPNPAVRLFFFSPAHLNRMFDGQGTPVPLKGFTKLRFLSKEFARLTERLEYYLKPDTCRLQNGGFRKVNTALTLYTGVYAVKVLAEHEDLARKIAAGLPEGVMAMRVLNGGPAAWIEVRDGRIAVGKGEPENATAYMDFRDADAAHAVLSGQVDSFQAIGRGQLALRGQVPLIESIGLILDRVERYLK
jgi:hypothetical protein